MAANALLLTDLIDVSSLYCSLTTSASSRQHLLFKKLASFEFQQMLLEACDVVFGKVAVTELAAPLVDVLAVLMHKSHVKHIS